MDGRTDRRTGLWMETLRPEGCFFLASGFLVKKAEGSRGGGDGAGPRPGPLCVAPRLGCSLLESLSQHGPARPPAPKSEAAALVRVLPWLRARSPGCVSPLGEGQLSGGLW